MALGKSCVGIYRSAGSRLVTRLELQTETFDNTPTDAFFPFGGLAGDIPGGRELDRWKPPAWAWCASTRQAECPQGNPFLLGARRWSGKRG